MSISDSVFRWARNRKRKNNTVHNPTARPKIGQFFYTILVDDIFCFHAYTFPVGTIWIGAQEGAIIDISYSPLRRGVERETPSIRQAALQLGEYFDGRRRQFSLPLSPAGTPFQRAVWNALLEISYGDMCTYGGIARAVGSPAGARAVGMACNRNPIAIVIPCHRVVGSTGRLTGYAGGLALKARLLQLEAAGKPERLWR